MRTATHGNLLEMKIVHIQQHIVNPEAIGRRKHAARAAAASIAISGLLLMTGCAEGYLQNRTANLAPSITEIEKAQIFDNLWILSDVRSGGDFIPSQFVLGSGSAGVTSQPTVGISPQGKLTNLWSTGSLSWSGQESYSWSVTPVTSYSDLQRLRLLYEYALWKEGDDQTGVINGERSRFAADYAGINAPYSSSGTVYGAPSGINNKPFDDSKLATANFVAEFLATLNALATSANNPHPSPGDSVLKGIDNPPKPQTGPAPSSGLPQLAVSLIQPAPALELAADLPLPPRSSPAIGTMDSAELRSTGILQLPDPGFVSKNRATSPDGHSWNEFPGSRGRMLYVRSQADLNEFVLWILSATPNTTGGGGAGGGAGGAGGGKGGGAKAAATPALTLQSQ